MNDSSSTLVGAEKFAGVGDDAPVAAGSGGIVGVEDGIGVKVGVGGAKSGVVQAVNNRIVMKLAKKIFGISSPLKTHLYNVNNVQADIRQNSLETKNQDTNFTNSHEKFVKIGEIRV